MDELITSHVSRDLASGTNTFVFLDLNRASNLKQITRGDKRPCTPITSPFTNWTPEELYEYWKIHVRSPMDKDRGRWTSFTFCILDETSVVSHDLVMCSNGPDFNEGHPETGEDEIKLKCIRMTFKAFCESMSNLEVLGCTPSEVNKPRHLNVWPPVVMVPDSPGALRGRVATREEMREQKRKVIWRAEREGMVVDGVISEKVPKKKGLHELRNVD